MVRHRIGAGFFFFLDIAGRLSVCIYFFFLRAKGRKHTTASEEEQGLPRANEAERDQEEGGERRLGAWGGGRVGRESLISLPEWAIYTLHTGEHQARVLRGTARYCPVLRSTLRYMVH